MPAGEELTSLGRTGATLAIHLSIRNLRQIERDLAAFEIDAGLTYLDFEPPTPSLSVPLYTEHYLLVGAAEGEGTQGDAAARPVDLAHG